VNTLRLPWAAWHSDSSLELAFPAEWEVTEARMQDAPGLADAQIAQAIDSPIGIPHLSQLARGRRDAAVVVEDTSRPAPLERVIVQVLNELEAGGLSRHRVRLLVGSASHRPLTRLDLVKKLGQATLDTVEVRNHNAYENLVELGTTSRGTPIHVNRTYAEADLKLAIGSIIPHRDAGFGGGAKLAGIGMAGVDTIAANHMAAWSAGHVGLGRIEDNPLRADIDEIAGRAGLEMIVNVVVNSRREIAGVFAGDPSLAFRQGTQFARDIYATPVPDAVDVAVFNAYPKDTEFIMGFNALNPGYGIGERLVQAGGTVVITMAASEGYGCHSGMDRYQFKYDASVSWQRRLIVYSPNVNQWDVDRLCPPGTLLFREAPALIRALSDLHPGRARAAVFPCGTLQLGGGEFKS
jgi:nickel-dependent lactate racemase